MTSSEIGILICGGGFILLFLLLLINAVHFYRVYYPEVARRIDGADLDTGFLFAASRFMHWGHLCVSETRARRFGVAKVFSDLPRPVRLQLIFHWAGVLLAIALLGAGYWLSSSVS